MEKFRIKDKVDFNLSQLQILKLDNLSGYKAELELIKYLLAYSPVLETMFIHLGRSVRTNEAFTITEEIKQFPRVSKLAEIRYLKRRMVTLFLNL